MRPPRFIVDNLELSNSEVRVMLIMYDIVGPKDQSDPFVWLPMSTICERTGIKMSSLYRILTNLRSKGLLQKVSRRRRNLSKSKGATPFSRVRGYELAPCDSSFELMAIRDVPQHAERRVTRGADLWPDSANTFHHCNPDGPRIKGEESSAVETKPTLKPEIDNEIQNREKQSTSQNCTVGFLKIAQSGFSKMRIIPPPILITENGKENGKENQYSNVSKSNSALSCSSLQAEHASSHKSSSLELASNETKQTSNPRESKPARTRVSPQAGAHTGDATSGPPLDDAPWGSDSSQDLAGDRPAWSDGELEAVESESLPLSPIYTSVLTRFVAPLRGVGP